MQKHARHKNKKCQSAKRYNKFDKFEKFGMKKANMATLIYDFNECTLFAFYLMESCCFKGHSPCLENNLFKDNKFKGFIPADYTILKHTRLRLIRTLVPLTFSRIKRRNGFVRIKRKISCSFHSHA